MSSAMGRAPTLRHDLRPGDLGGVAAQHGVLYAVEFGFDHTFEAYVAASLAEFGRDARPDRGRLWVAERNDCIVGSIGIVLHDDAAAQLRWFLVHPDERGHGLGRRMIEESIAFCRAGGCTSVFLWTVGVLVDAARLYTAAGFHKSIEQPPAQQWGTTVTEQRYELTL